MNFIPGQEESAAASDGPPDMGDESSAFVGEGEAKKPQMSRGTAALLGLLVACGGGLYFMYAKNGPKPASAADVQAASDVDTFLASGEQHVALMQKMLQNTQGVVAQFKAYPEHTQVPVEMLRTNPFRHFAPKDAPETESEAAVRRRREQERAGATDAAKSMRLQSIMNGRVKAAMINGKLVQVGQEVEGFTLEQVTAETVIVRKGDYRFELRMKR